jgi:hypothetical protein
MGNRLPNFVLAAAIVEPAQFLQAVVVHLARHVIERVPEEMHVAALPRHLGEHFPDRCLETLVVVGDDKLDTGEAARPEP